jgi:urease accessory protein
MKTNSHPPPASTAARGLAGRPARAMEIALHQGDTADSLTLPYEARYRRRGLLRTDCGEEILLDLAEATELREGDALVLEDGRFVPIRAAAEPLAEVRAEVRAGGAALARLAWHIGNRHTPAQVETERLLIQRDHVLEDMLRGLGATVTHIEAPFTPEGGAYGHGRTHAHGHSHDPQHDPNAHIPHRRG